MPIFALRRCRGGSWSKSVQQLTFKMALHVPRLRAGAIPPVNYPPLAPANLLPTCSAIVALGSAVVHSLSAVLRGADETADAFRQWLASICTLFLFLLLGYYHVSARILRRRPWYGSRYGGPGEMFKLLCLAPALVLLGGDLGAACAHSWAQAAWVLAAFVAALHFTLLDNAPALQRFGLKFSAPSRWGQCSAAERAFAAALAASALGLGASLALSLAQGGAPAAGTLAARLGSLAALLAAAWAPVRATHTLHVHHYAAALAALPWTAASDGLGCGSAAPRLPSFRRPTHPPPPVSERRALALRAAALGVLVESSAVWGLDPCVVPRAGSAAAAAVSDVPTLVWLAAVAAVPRPTQWRLLQRICEAACAPLARGGVGLHPSVGAILERTAAARPTELAALLRRDLDSDTHAPEKAELPLPPRAAELVEVVRRGLSPSAEGEAQEGTCLGVVATLCLGWFAGAVEISGAVEGRGGGAGGALAAVPSTASRDAFWSAHARLRAECDALEEGLGLRPRARRALQAVREAVCAALAESFA